MDPQKFSDDGRPLQPHPNHDPFWPNTAPDDIPMSDGQGPARPGAVVGGPPDQQQPPAGDPAPQPSFAPPFTAPAIPKRKRKLKLVSLIVAAVVLLMGAGAAAYFTYYLPNQPENILKAALANSFSKDKISSARFEGELNFEGKEDERMSLDFNGAASKEGKLEFAARVDALVTTVTFDVRSTDGKTFYAKLGGLEGLPELLGATGGDEVFGSFVPLIAQVNDQWYEINESLAREMAGVNPGAGTQGLSDEDRSKLAGAYGRNQFLSVREVLEDEEINATPSHHYKVVADGAKLKSFMDEVKSADIDSLGLAQDVLNGLKDSVDSTDLSKHPIDVWIAKDTKLFTQFAYTTQTEDGETIDLRLTIPEYNQPVNIEKPEGAKSVLELLGPIFEAAQEFQESFPEQFPVEDPATGISL